MPSVTIFLPSDRMPPATVLADLAAACATLCTDILQAAPETVHVLYVPAIHGRGQPISAEILYRLTDTRTPAVMEDFMTQLDAAIHAHTGCIARIRCTGHAATTLYACN